MELDRLLVARMRTQHAQRRRRRRAAGAPRPWPGRAPRTRSRSCHRVAARGTRKIRAWCAPTRTAGDRSCRWRAASPSARARPAAAGSPGRNGSRRSCRARPPSRTRTPAPFRRRATCTSGQGPSGTRPVKSGASASSSLAPSPKSKPTSLASFKRSDAENGLPEPAPEAIQRTEPPFPQQACRLRRRRAAVRP